MPSKERKPPSTVATGFGGSSSAFRVLDLERAQVAGPSDAEATLRELPSRLRSIVERVAKEYELPPHEVLTGRGATATEARHCAFWLTTKLASSMSAAGIATAFRRDPTTVRDGVRTFFARLKVNPDLTARVSQWLKQLTT